MKIDNLVTRPIEVTQDFCDYRDNEFNKGSYYRRKNCDYLLLEWWLVDKKLVSPPLSWRHDFILKLQPPHLVDCKRMATDNFNIKNAKTRYNLESSIKGNQLTHFLLYNTKDPRGSGDKDLLRPGDIVPHKFINYIESNIIMTNLKESQFSGWYYKGVI